MKFEKQQARTIKYQALYWLRLKQRCAFIATEVGGYSADVLGVSEKKAIEVEVKTNLDDLKADFKKWKHREYCYRPEHDSSDYTSQKRWVPTHFYFAVPSELVAPAIAEVEKRGFDSYGVINADTWTISRRAKWLHPRPPSSELKFQLALRMGSELLRFHEAWV